MMRLLVLALVLALCAALQPAPGLQLSSGTSSRAAVSMAARRPSKKPAPKTGGARQRPAEIRALLMRGARRCTAGSATALVWQSLRAGDAKPLRVCSVVARRIDGVGTKRVQL